MELLLVRHGVAGEGTPDAARALTKDGRRKAREAARGLAALVDGAGVVATSPLVRAAQTAELVSDALGAEVVTVEALAPGQRYADALAWLRRRRDERVVLVGHEPHLSGLASWLMTGRDRSVLELKKAQAVLLELPSFKPGTARLVWSVPPKALRKI